MRIAATITLNDADRELLQRWARGRSTPARLVLRANIVLRAADGARNDVIAAELGTNRLLVGKWRKRSKGTFSSRIGCLISRPTCCRYTSASPN